MASQKKWDWEVEYVGHPLVEVIDRYKSQVSDLSQTAGRGLANDQLSADIVALLPGSRKQEIVKKLPVMLEVSKLFPGYQFIVAKAPGLAESFYDKLLKAYPHVSYVADSTYDLLLQAKAALVTSGTATLETALFGVPEVVCYKGSFLSYQIGKRLVKINYISLVNLIMDKPVVKELIQDKLTVENLQKELSQLLADEKRIAELNADYILLRNLLGQGGNASAKAAQSMVSFLSQ